MTKYAEVLYPKDDKNQYPKKLAGYIYNRFIKNYQNGDANKKILDIGCSSGKALKRFAEFENLELYGVDIRDEKVDGITFKECNIEKDKIPFPDNYFDFVYSKSVLEHVINTDNFISEARRVLKPGGVFIGLTPDWKSCRDIFWDDYTHVKPFTRKGLRDVLLIYNFHQAECEYFYQLPFTWNHNWLKIIPKIISFLPDFLKWKTKEQRNTKDRKLIRFSKEIMLLSYGKKS